MCAGIFGLTTLTHRHQSTWAWSGWHLSHVRSRFEWSCSSKIRGLGCVHHSHEYLWWIYLFCVTLHEEICFASLLSPCQMFPLSFTTVTPVWRQGALQARNIMFGRRRIPNNYAIAFRRLFVHTDSPYGVDEEIAGEENALSFHRLRFLSVFEGLKPRASGDRRR